MQLWCGLQRLISIPLVKLHQLRDCIAMETIWSVDILNHGGLFLTPTPTQQHSVKSEVCFPLPVAVL